MLRNLSWLAAAHVLVKPAWLAFLTLGCSRLLGLSGYGEMAAALALTGMLSIASDLGTADHLTRESVRTPARAGELFKANLRLRYGMGSVIVLASVVVAVTLGPPMRDPWLYAGAAAYAIGLRLHDLCRAIYRSAERMHDEAASIVVERVLSIALGGLALWTWTTPRAVVVALAVSSLFSWGLNMIWIQRAYSESHSTAAPSPSLGSLMRETRWFSLYALTAPIFLSTGPILLDRLDSAYAAGVYSVSSRLVEAAQLIPSLLSAVLLPRMSRETHPATRWGVAGRLLIVSSLSGASAMVALYLASPFLAPLFAPEGLAHEIHAIVRVMRLTAFCLPLLSLCYVANTALLATGRTAFAALWQLSCGAATVALQVWLIPQSGPEGAVQAVIVGLSCLLIGVLIRLYADARAATQEGLLLPPSGEFSPSVT